MRFALALLFAPPLLQNILDKAGIYLKRTLEEGQRRSRNRRYSFEH
jgi:hypothetical protein